MKKISVNNKQGYLVFNDQRNRGAFLYVASGVKHGRPWKHLRVHDMMKSPRDKEVLAMRRRKVTDYDMDPKKGNGSVTNHTDLIVEQIPEICVAMMEIYRLETGVSRAESEVAMKDAEEKNMDQVDVLIKKAGGMLG